MNDNTFWGTIPAYKQKTCYVAGPMRGYPESNFPAFDAAEQALTEQGWGVISPAAMDRVSASCELPDIIHRDLEAVQHVDALVLLPGWEKSTGTQAELAVAIWAEKEILLYPDMTPLMDRSILAEADSLVNGPRQNSYGPPDQDFRRTATMWSALKGVEFTPREVAMFMICVKLSRETHQKKRDNWVDMAGYAACGSKCKD